MKKETISFSKYLLDQGLINEEQLEKALAIQNQGRLLGTLASQTGIIGAEDILVIKEYQDVNGVQFGEAAISLGFLTSSQLKYLLDLRLRKKVRIGEILVKEGFIQKDKLYKALMHFESNRHRLKRILICVSTDSLCKNLKDILGKYDYEVTTTANPSDAVVMAGKKTPDLLIIGESFEDMAGLDICTQILSNPKLANIHIVFLARKLSKELVDQAFEIGVHHFLKKPVQEYELLNVVYNIEQRDLENKEEKILVVEDSKWLRHMMVNELKQHGYKVIQASNGNDALILAKNEKPDLITLDIIMPGMDGYETCKKLREDPLTHDIPVIMITALDSQEEREKGFKAGAIEYFLKPFTPDQLTNYISLLFESQKAQRMEKAVVIDDTLSTLHIIKHVLKKQGIEAITATNGKDGLKKIKEYTPDIIISDVYMPGMDGYQVCHKVKVSPETKHIPLILLTSSGKKEDILKGLAFGANDYIVKPFDENELLSRAVNLLASKKLYDEVQDMNRKLELNNAALKKLNQEREKFFEERENFYSILTHDLRSPSCTIISALDTMLEETGNTLEEPQMEYWRMIKASAGRQLNIVGDALEIFQFETGEELTMEKEDLSKVIHEVILSYYKGIKEKEIHVNGELFSPKEISSPMPCKMNKFKISRVMENLLSNAAKYANNRIDVFWEKKEKFIEVCVSDDGNGISDEFKDKVFENFFQVPGSQAGSGLGLSSCKKIIEAHKGKIWIESSPGSCDLYFTLLGQ